MLMHRDFETWFKTFRESINRYDYYTDFAKVYENAEKFKRQIYLLNSLVGSKNIEQEFEDLLTEYPKCLQAVPILLAVRASEIYCQDERGAVTYNFNAPNQSIEQYKYFMRQTGLFDLLGSHVIANLYDYVTGVEVGLDSNGRKNRGGHQMENLVESFLKKASVTYHKEKYIDDVEEMFGLDLSAISAGGTSTKRFDFVAKVSRKVFGIETNFYASGGSKLNETARSYKMLAEESRTIQGFKFVWITDGEGWQSARKNLKETFLVLDNLYNIKDLEDGTLTELFK